MGLLKTKAGYFMKRISIIFLRIAIVFIGLGVLAVCALLLPGLWADIAIEFPGYSYAIYAVFTAIFATTLPFFLGLYEAWRLLTYIDRGMAFTKESAKTLKAVALAAGTISFMYVVALPFFYIWGDNDDAPGVILIGIILVCTPTIAAVFAYLLHRLIHEAADIKTENELTV
jgi:hypothetical protein